MGLFSCQNLVVVIIVSSKRLWLKAVHHLHHTVFSFCRTRVFFLLGSSLKSILSLSTPLSVCHRFVSADENGKDQGINVRQRVKEIVDFVQDDDRLREERKKAKKNKDKYIGVSSDTMGYRGYGKFDLEGAAGTDKRLVNK